MKSLIKLLGLSIGCSCSAMQSQKMLLDEVPADEAAVVSALDPENTLLQPKSDLSALQDINKIYAL